MFYLLLLDSRNLFVGGIPLILAAVMTEKTLVINDFQLDAVGASTFASIILFQVLRGIDGYKGYFMWIKKQYRYYKYGGEEKHDDISRQQGDANDSLASVSKQEQKINSEK